MGTGDARGEAGRHIVRGQREAGRRDGEKERIALSFGGTGKREEGKWRYIRAPRQSRVLCHLS